MVETTENSTIQQLINGRFRFEAEQISYRPDRDASKMDDRDAEWNQTARHWRCTIRRYKNRRMVIYFSQGSAHTEPPTMEEVLDCMASDSSGFENARTFEEWCSEYGYDTDSRKAHAMFKEVEKQAHKLRRFLGDEDYDRLLWHTERL